MNAFGFRADIKITEVLKKNSFTLSAEVIPPRNGSEQQNVLTQVQKLIEAGAEYLSVTKGAGGSLRGGSLPIAQAIKESFSTPSVAHFTCRDLLPVEVENALIDHHYFGIRNILALRGDPPQDQPNWNPRPESYPHAYQLVEQIKTLNEGRYLNRPSDAGSLGQERTDFCIGVAAYPEHPNETERWRFLQRKVQAGADYAITQMLFDADAYGRYLDLLERNQIVLPIIPGTRVLKDRKQADLMRKLFQVSIAEDLYQALPEVHTDGPPLAGIEQCQRLIEKMERHGAPGVHLFVLFDTQSSCDLLQRLRIQFPS